MKKLLSLFMLMTSVFCFVAEAQNTYITPYGSRLARLTLNKNSENTGLRYSFFATGLQQSTSPTTAGDDSCVYQMDTTSCHFGILRQSTGTKTGYLVLDSNSVVTTARNFKVSSRLSTPMGTNVASANNISLGYGANTFLITGTTQVNLIDTTGWDDGDQAVLIFNASVTVADSSARSGVYAPINLSGGNNLSATANDVLTIMIRNAAGTGKEWWEVSRTVNAD